MAAWYVLKSRFIRSDLIYIASVCAPGDHAFCIVTDTPIAERNRTVASVREFCQSSVAPGYLVIDPWLNTTCTADQYLLQSGKKLAEWNTEAKRIYWDYGSKGAGWYPPTGEYASEFANAPLQIDPF
jgi:hypothetical protein